MRRKSSCDEVQLAETLVWEDSKMTMPAASGVGLTRTDMNCECGKNFIAKLDFSLNGNHIVECPYCGHEHCREIVNGKVTSERWDSHNTGPRIMVDQRCVWKSDSQPIVTTTAAAFLRDLWLNKSEM